MSHQKILDHPDFQEIVSKLTSGQTVRSVDKWLKIKYENNKALQINPNDLNSFRANYLNIEKNILEDIQTIKKESQMEELSEKARELVKTNKTYQEKVEEFVDTQIDWRKKLIIFLNAAETRFAQLYDNSQMNPNNIKPDKTMIEWFRGMLDIIKEIRKIEGAPDQVIQHNMSIQVIDEKVALFQQAFINTVAELDIDTASQLIDKFNSNIKLISEKKEHIGIFNNFNEEKVETLITKMLPENFNKK